jgi:hypothetical protein
MQPVLSSAPPDKPASTSSASMLPLEQAIVRTLVYADLFDFPLTADEIYRYLEGMCVPAAAVTYHLENGLRAYLWYQSPYYGLPGREDGAATRRRRVARARQLWSDAGRYGRFLAHFPFVRMVAVTGSLAVNNPHRQADIDYLIVTENGRLWLCRAFVILLVRLAAQCGVVLCPNYLLSQQALYFPDHNLYAAHELTQMVPLSGLDVYAQMRRQNSWTARYLPNAGGPPPHAPIVETTVASGISHLIEAGLQNRLGQHLEQWEMKRKMRKFVGQQTSANREIAFSPDYCKGHFEGHAHRTLQTYHQRLTEWQSYMPFNS